MDWQSFFLGVSATVFAGWGVFGAILLAQRDSRVGYKPASGDYGTPVPPQSGTGVRSVSPVISKLPSGLEFDPVTGHTSFDVPGLLHEPPPGFKRDPKTGHFSSPPVSSGRKVREQK